MTNYKPAIVNLKNTTVLNIREQPNALSTTKVLGVLHDGDYIEYDLDYSNNGWYKIKKDSVEGYSSKTYIDSMGNVLPDETYPPTNPATAWRDRLYPEERKLLEAITLWGVEQPNCAAMYENLLVLRLTQILDNSVWDFPT